MAIVYLSPQREGIKLTVTITVELESKAPILTHPGFGYSPTGDIGQKLAAWLVLKVTVLQANTE